MQVSCASFGLLGTCEKDEQIKKPKKEKKKSLKSFTISEGSGRGIERERK